MLVHGETMEMAKGLTCSRPTQSRPIRESTNLRHLSSSNLTQALKSSLRQGSDLRVHAWGKQKGASTVKVCQSVQRKKGWSQSWEFFGFQERVMCFGRETAVLELQKIVLYILKVKLADPQWVFEYEIDVNSHYKLFIHHASSAYTAFNWYQVRAHNLVTNGHDIQW